MSRTLPPRFTEVFSKPASSLSSEPEFAAGRPRPAGTCGDSDGPDGGHGLFVGRSLAQSERSRPGRAVRVSRPADRLSRPTRTGRLPACPSLPVVPSESRLGTWPTLETPAAAPGRRGSAVAAVPPAGADSDDSDASRNTEVPGRSFEKAAGRPGRVHSATRQQRAPRSKKGPPPPPPPTKHARSNRRHAGPAARAGPAPTAGRAVPVQAGPA